MVISNRQSSRNPCGCQKAGASPATTEHGRGKPRPYDGGNQ